MATAKDSMRMKVQEYGASADTLQEQQRAGQAWTFVDCLLDDDKLLASDLTGAMLVAAVLSKRPTGSPGLPRLSSTSSTKSEVFFNNIGKYVGGDSMSMAVTNLSKHCAVTFQHGPHETWEIGGKIQMYVNNADSTQRKEIEGTVRHISSELDYILLETPSCLEVPVISLSCYCCQPYVIVGASARSQSVDPISVRHGVVMSTRVDEKGFIRGDMPSIEGDSGGGCFAEATGHLFAMNVRTTPEGAALLPISIPYSMAANLGLILSCP